MADENAGLVLGVGKRVILKVGGEKRGVEIRDAFETQCSRWVGRAKEKQEGCLFGLFHWKCM
jgi:hypothetical protein